MGASTYAVPMAALTLSTYGWPDPRARHLISRQFYEVSVVMSILEMRKYRVGEVKDFPKTGSQAENGTPHPGLPLTPLLNKELSSQLSSKAKDFCCPNASTRKEMKAPCNASVHTYSSHFLSTICICASDWQSVGHRV